MIAKILSSSASFSGVAYNTDKVSAGLGRLLKVANFGALGILSNLRPSDYINYLKAVSSTNRRISKPQFHAVISAKGKSMGAEELTNLAEQWLSKMGYAENPYLIIFHSDTSNNHVHMVSTRVDKSGSKISSAFEKIRAVSNLHKCLAQNPAKNHMATVQSLFGYRFSTQAQFRLLLEQKGFQVTQLDDKIKISSGSIFSEQMTTKDIELKISNTQKDSKRLMQLQQIFLKYTRLYDTALVLSASAEPGANKSFSSAFGEFVFSTFGIQLVYHREGNKIPYGYTLIDHSGKNIFKGGEVLALKQFNNLPLAEVLPSQDEKPLFIHLQTAVPIPETDVSQLQAAENASVAFQLSGDIDDEALLGRNRQRKGKARTNTR